MSETFEEKLEELRKKHPGSITEADRAFLTARRSYLQPHELESFGIEEPEAQTETEAEPEDDELISETEEGVEPPKLPKRSKAKAKSQE